MRAGVRCLSTPCELREFVSRLPAASAVFDPLGGEWLLLLPLVILLDEYALAEAITDANERLSLQQQLKNVFPSKFDLRHIEERRAKLGSKAEEEGCDVSSLVSSVKEFPSWDAEKKYCVEDLVAYYDVRITQQQGRFARTEKDGLQ